MISHLLAELELLIPKEEFLCSLELVSEELDKKEIKKLGFEKYLGQYMILEGYRNHDPDEISLQKLIDKLRICDSIKDKGILEIGIKPENSKCDKLLSIHVENGECIANEYTTTFEPAEYCLPVYNVKEISKLPCLTQCKQLNELYGRLSKK